MIFLCNLKVIVWWVQTVCGWNINKPAVCVYVCVCSVVLVQVIQEWVVLSPSTPQHLSFPFLLQKNRDRREESQPERALNLNSNVNFESISYFPLLIFLSPIWSPFFHKILFDPDLLIYGWQTYIQVYDCMCNAVGAWYALWYRCVLHTCWYCLIASFSCWIRLSSSASGRYPPGMT